jgi:hypothetical protein
LTFFGFYGIIKEIGRIFTFDGGILMPQYNEQVGSHLPAIHEDTYTWNEFIDLLKQTEGETYETDKIYFI